MERLKFGRIIDAALAYAKKNGMAWVYWDFGQGGPRPRAKPSWTLEATLVGCFKAGTNPRDVLDAIEAFQREYRLQTKKQPRRGRYDESVDGGKTGGSAELDPQHGRAVLECGGEVASVDEAVG